MYISPRPQQRAIYLAQFTCHALVVCPRCGRCADVVALAQQRPRAACPFCAWSRRDTSCRCGAVSGALKPRRSMVLGAARDPHFQLPLWLVASVRGETLWAYNREHLAFIERWIGAGIRVRPLHVNGGLASRLPTWMKRATAREDVLAAIARVARRDPAVADRRCG